MLLEPQISSDGGGGSVTHGTRQAVARSTYREAD